MAEPSATRSIDKVAARPGWPELARANEDLHAAEVLLGDPLVPGRAVVSPLREFWRSLLAAAKAADLGASAEIDAEALAEGDPTTWLGQELTGVDARARAELRRGWTTLRASSPASSDPAPDKVALRRHAEDARKLLAILEPIVGGVPLRRRRRRLLWTAVGLTILFAPLAVYVAMRASIEGEGPWRASYFTDRKLESTPIVVREVEVDHDWSKDAPLEAVPPDKFSVRWDTCMRIDETGPVVFQVNANDGARVIVDGETVIDAWDRNSKTRKRGRGAAEVEIEAGVHHLRVEYYESLGTASIKLAASFAGEPPTALPTSRLIYPGDDLDEDNPCAGAGAEAPTEADSESKAEAQDETKGETSSEG